MVFVNRGWIPRTSMHTYLKPSGPLTLRCLVAKTEDQKNAEKNSIWRKTSLFMPKNTESAFVDKKQLIYVEREKLQRVQQEIVPRSSNNNSGEILLFDALCDDGEEDGEGRG
ncbi:hypothetical protein EON65_10715, partial [archaeon]